MSGLICRKTISLLAALFVVLTSLMAPASVYAYEAMDMTKNGTASLTLQLPAPSSNVKLYFVADMDDQTNITLKNEYKNLGVSLDDVESSEDWAVKAELMSAQLIGTDIEPMVAATNESNQAVFENLSFGIYLVVVDGCATETNKYTVIPSLISVPNSTDGDTWIYDVNATVKYETSEITPPPTRFVVRKTWTNDGAGETRPEEVQIDILKRATSGDEWEKVESVSLNSGNNWSYEWAAESDGAEWTVKEMTKDSNYTIASMEPVTDENGVRCFLITNQYLTPTPTPTVTVTATPTPTTRMTATPTPRTTAKATATPRPKVTTTVTHTTPKTGDDQNIILPVIGVLAAGVVLILLGLNIRKKSGKDE